MALVLWPAEVFLVLDQVPLTQVMVPLALVVVGGGAGAGAGGAPAEYVAATGGAGGATQPLNATWGMLLV